MQGWGRGQDQGQRQGHVLLQRRPRRCTLIWPWPWPWPWSWPWPWPMFWNANCEIHGKSHPYYEWAVNIRNMMNSNIKSRLPKTANPTGEKMHSSTRDIKVLQLGNSISYTVPWTPQPNPTQLSSAWLSSTQLNSTQLDWTQLTLPWTPQLINVPEQGLGSGPGPRSRSRPDKGAAPPHGAAATDGPVPCSGTLILGSMVSKSGPKRFPSKRKSMKYRWTIIELVYYVSDYPIKKSLGPGKFIALGNPDFQKTTR